MAIPLLYFLTVSVLSGNGPNLPRVVTDVAKALNYSTADGNFLFKFTVAGEAKILAVVSVQNNTALNRITNRLYGVAKLDITSQPMIAYESFARNLGVSADLTGPYNGTLDHDNIVWMNFNVDYNNKTTDELLGIWKTEAEAALGLRKNGDLRGVLFKNLGEREVQIFINAPDPDQIDLLSFNLPIVRAIGSDIRINTKGLEFLK